jgi:hypothetical protein
MWLENRQNSIFGSIAATTSGSVFKISERVQWMAAYICDWNLINTRIILLFGDAGDVILQRPSIIPPPTLRTGKAFHSSRAPSHHNPSSGTTPPARPHYPILAPSVLIDLLEPDERSVPGFTVTALVVTLQILRLEAVDYCLNRGQLATCRSILTLHPSIPSRGSKLPTLSIARSFS